MKSLTFKQYLLESKSQLLQAIDNTPVTIVEYEIRKYCSFGIGETEDEKTLISLRPKNKIIVEWRYNNLIKPTPNAIKFVGSKDIEDNETCSTFIQGSKLQQWLKRYAGEGQNHGHKV